MTSICNSYDRPARARGWLYYVQLHILDCACGVWCVWYRLRPTMSTPRTFYSGSRKQTSTGRSTSSLSCSGTWTPSSTPQRNKRTTGSAVIADTPRAGKTRAEQNLRNRRLILSTNCSESDSRAHFRPGEVLRDRTDLYVNNSDSEEEPTPLEDPFTESNSSNSQHFTPINSRSFPEVQSFAEPPSVTPRSFESPLVTSRRREPTDLSLHLQKQQATLLQVIQQQDTFKEQNLQLGQRLDALESTVAELSTYFQSTPPPNQATSRIAKELTVSFYRIL